VDKAAETSSKSAFLPSSGERPCFDKQDWVIDNSQPFSIALATGAHSGAKVNEQSFKA